MQNNTWSLLILAVFAGCGSGGSGTQTEGAGTVTGGSTTTGTLTVSVSARDSAGIDRVIYKVGEEIEFVAVFDNQGSSDVTLTAPDGCGLVQFLVEDKFASQASPIFDSHAGRVCTLALVPHVIAAGSKVEIPFTWKQVDSRGRPVRAGNYLVEARIRDVGGFSSPAALDLSVGGNIIFVSRVALNNGIIASEAYAKVGLLSTRIGQSSGQSAIDTATHFARIISADPNYDANAVAIGRDFAEVRVNWANGAQVPYIPVVFDVGSNDPGQRVSAP